MTVWFTSDTHFSHKNIIRYCNRPFGSVEEMNDHLIKMWNHKVAEGDLVYHLGDFAFIKNRDEMDRLVYSLKGEKHLIYGNHDKGPVRQAKGWASKKDYNRIEVEGQKIVLCHYPFETWHGAHRGAWHLHGHCHGTLPVNYRKKRIDVGVDPRNFRPVSFDEVRELMKNHVHVAVDHHKERDL